MRPRALLLVVAPIVAFSPVLVELAGHMRAEAWARYALVFAPLVALVLAREAPTTPRRDGLLLLGLALAVELFCLAGNTTRLARPAFPLAIVGLCRALGLARGRSALLALWLVPIPWAVLKLTSPGLEDTWLQLAGQIVQTLGGEIELQQRQVLGSAAVLTVDAADSGVRLMALLAGLGWYAALRCGDPLTGCARRALLWAAWGLPAQALASLLAVGTLALGSDAAARWLLDPGIWLVLAVLGVSRAEQLVHRQAQQRRPG